ncbi:TetR family transcriptional regulator [Streptomyces sp. NPDC093544]|jgi:AcrR family transcriptional regulator|uniref:TetR family transcriptional regulator n=1 Tax=Streptomyces sp. NPDC093544 TaxID=3155200 RepID=UPI0034445909
MALEQAAVPTPAQRRKDRQRRLIIREAAQLFEENGGEEGGGFEKTTAEAIAERSDISVSTFFRYFRTKADVIYLDLHNAIDEHLAAVARRLTQGHDPAAAVAESSVEILNRFIADEDNKARVVRSFRSPNFDDPRALWTGRWSDRLAELLRAQLPESDDRDLRARVTATVCLNTAWAAVQQWATEGLDEPLEPILKKAFGLAATAAGDAAEAVRPG